jgi:hypothetical protein
MTTEGSAERQILEFLHTHPSHGPGQVGGRRIPSGSRAWNERTLRAEIVGAGIAPDPERAAELLAGLTDKGRIDVETDHFDRSDEVGPPPKVARRFVYLATEDQLSQP